MRIALVFISLLLAGCTASTKLKHNSLNSDNGKMLNDYYLVFHSAGNGVADILLTLKTDNTFTFYMKMLPQPGTEDVVSIINTSGKWTKQGKWTRLTFKNKKMLLSAVFDKSYADNNQFKIINERTVDINNGLDEITIWGVACVKKQE